MYGALLLVFLSCAWSLDFWPITALSHNEDVFALYACFPEGTEWWICFSKVTHDGKSSLEVQTRAIFKGPLHNIPEFTTLSFAVNDQGLLMFASESANRGSVLVNFCRDTECTGIVSQDIQIQLEEQVMLLRPRVSYDKKGSPVIAFVKAQTTQSTISLIYCLDSQCSKFSETDIMQVPFSLPVSQGFDFQFILDNDAPRFLYTDGSSVKLVACDSMDCSSPTEKILSNETDIVGGASLNPGVAVVAYPDKLSILHYDLSPSPFNIPIPSFQSVFLSSFSNKVQTEIALQYWDTVGGRGVVEYLQCPTSGCQRNLTQQSVDVFRVLKGPWNPSIAITSITSATWLFYFKYPGNDLYALNCPKVSGVSCRYYVVNNETAIVENQDQEGEAPSSLTWVWLVVTGSVIVVSLIVYLVARSVNQVIGRIEYEEVKGEEWTN